MSPKNLNTPGLGGEYEVHVSALFALLLNINPDIKDFRLRSNVQDFGNLDDLLIDIKTKGGGDLYFAFQLKHTEKSNKNLLPDNFEAKGDFKLEKYCEAFKKLSEENRKKYRFILYTNKNFDSSRTNEVNNFCMKATQDVCCFGKNFFDTSGDGNNLYRFRVNANTQGGKNVNREDYRKFFSKLSLYTGQANLRDTKKSILDIIKYKECCAIYVEFFRKWHGGDFIDKIIDKKTLNVHLLDILLSTVKINYHLSDGQEGNSIFFETMVQQFDITIIDTSKQEFIEHLEENILKYPEEFNNSEEIIKLGKKNKLLDRSAKEIKEETKVKLLHFFYPKFINQMKENLHSYLQVFDKESQDYMIQFVKDDNKLTYETKLKLLHYFYQKFMKRLIENIQQYPEEFNQSLEVCNKDSEEYMTWVKYKKFIEELMKGTELRLLQNFYQKFIKRLKENVQEYLEEFDKSSEEYMIKFIKDDNKFIEELKEELKLKLLEDFHQKFIKRLKENFQKYFEEFENNSEKVMVKFVKDDNKFIERLREETRVKLLHYFYQKPLILDFNESSKDVIYEASKLCKIQENEIKLVILGQNIDKSKFSHLKIFTNLTGVDRYFLQETKKRCKLFLQGRNISFGEIFEDEIREFVTPKEIFQMLKGNFSIGEGKEKLPKCYIPRTVSTTLFDIESIIKDSYRSSAIMFFYEDKFKEVQSLIQNIVDGQDYLYEDSLVAIIWRKQEDSKDKYNQDISRDPFPEIITLRKEECSRFAKDRLDGKPKEKDVHFFKVIDEKRCLLLMSTKNTPFKETYTFSKMSVEENNINVFFNNSINILCAQPGMGKSTLLKYLKNECDSNFWTVMVDLKAHNQFLKRNCKIEYVLTYFLELENRHDVFLLSIKKMFLEKRKIVFFLDGLDEVENECIGYVLNVTRQLSEMGFRIWLSSRQNLKQRIENYFNIFTIEIDEINKNQQKKYIEERLMSQYNENEIEEIVQKIFHNTDLANNCHILEIPLQLHIITQIFLDDRSYYYNFSKNNFILTKMLEIFFGGKYKHFVTKIKAENLHLLGTLEEQFENYELVALHSVLDDEHFQKLQIENSKLSQIKIWDFRLGIITEVNSENKAVFEHLTFAEYFASKFLVKNFDKARILRKEIFSEKYQNLLLIFNIMLAEDSPLHLAIIYKDLDRIEEMEQSSLVDKGGRNFLQVAACVATRHPLLKSGPASFSSSECLVRDKPVQYFKGEDFKIKKIVNSVLSTEAFKNDKIFEWNSLDYALATGSLYIVEAILEKSEKPFNFYEILGQYYSGEVVTYYSIRFGYHRLLSAIIEKNSCRVTNIISDYLLWGRQSILHFLFFTSDCTNKTRIVELLAGDNINKAVYDKNRDTFLHFAVLHKDTEFIKFLFEKRADVNMKNKNGQSPLFYAVEQKNLEISELLVEKGADVNINDEKEKSPLFLAVGQNNFEITKFLVEKGADVNNKDSETRSPLLYAVGRNNFEISELLVKYGADVNITGENGWWPLLLAVNKNNLEISKLLIEKGANIDIKDEYGRSVPSIVRYDFDPGIDVCYLHLGSPLLVAVDQNNFEISKLLVEKGADVNIKNDFGHSPLLNAVKESNLEISKLLVEYGADVNIKDKEGKSPLFYAMDRNNLEISKLLVDKGADVNVKDKDGKSLLFYAVKQNNNLEMSKLLFESGAED